MEGGENLNTKPVEDFLADVCGILDSIVEVEWQGENIAFAYILFKDDFSIQAFIDEFCRKQEPFLRYVRQAPEKGEKIHKFALTNEAVESIYDTPVRDPIKEFLGFSHQPVDRALIERGEIYGSFRNWMEASLKDAVVDI